MPKQFLFTLIVTTFLYSQSNSFFNDSRRGWHYYEPEVKEKEIQKKERISDDVAFMRSVPLNSLDDLSVKEYTEIFERVKSIATMRPTKENVKIMQIMNKWQTEQSERFAKVWAINLLEDPNLEYPNIVDTKFAKISKIAQKDKETEDFFKSKKDRLAFVIFYGNLNQDAINRQKEVYEHIQRLYGIQAKFIDIDNKPLIKERFKLTTSPENFFLYKNKNGEAIWHRIKARLATQSEILSNTRFLFDNVIIEKDK
ncbi:conjugal transfer protein TraF [Helicobacter sp. CaF467b]|nr:conjugal transfer protein TraF [Helicobacter sp. CaF467b]MCI2236367.1 conjugal transfer protein TraF [Helicobacter sp. CaF467b]